MRINKKVDVIQILSRDLSVLTLAYLLTDVVSSGISTRVANGSSSRCSPGMCGRPVTHMGLALDVVSASIVWKRWINRLTLIPISGIIHTGKGRDLGSR